MNNNVALYLAAFGSCVLLMNLHNALTRVNIPKHFAFFSMNDPPCAAKSAENNQDPSAERR